MGVFVGVAMAGKVFAAGNNPAVAQAAAPGRTHSADGLCWSALNERSPITGLCGLALTSSTGAKSRLIPVKRQFVGHGFADPISEIDMLRRTQAQRQQENG